MKKNTYIQEIGDNFKQGRVDIVMNLLKQHHCLSSSENIQAILDQLPERWKMNFIELTRDILVEYPHSLLGCAMLIYTEPSSESTSQYLKKNHSFRLPLPSQEQTCPLEGLTFIGWYSPFSELPIDTSPSSQQRITAVPWQKLTAVVAMFQVRSEPEVSNLEIPVEWWADILYTESTNTHLSSGKLLPYPDSMEIGRIIQDANKPDAPIPNFIFLEKNLCKEANVDSSKFIKNLSSKSSSF